MTDVSCYKLSKMVMVREKTVFTFELELYKRVQICCLPFFDFTVFLGGERFGFPTLQVFIALGNWLVLKQNGNCSLDSFYIPVDRGQGWVFMYDDPVYKQNGSSLDFLCVSM